jgi:mono/diheme cytochrome c family protein
MTAMQTAIPMMSAFGLLILAGAGAAAAADAQNGATLARRWCAPCHVVASDQRQPTGEASPFAAIAKRQKFDAAKVAFFLLLPHPRMPDMALSRSEAEDLAVYIGSLAK